MGRNSRELLCPFQCIVMEIQMSVCPNIGDVSFDQVVKWCLPDFSTVKLLFFQRPHFKWHKHKQ